jgi:hypothetical protein
VREAHPRLGDALAGPRAARGGDRGAQVLDRLRRPFEVQRHDAQRAQRDRRRLVIIALAGALEGVLGELAQPAGIVADQPLRLVGERGRAQARQRRVR